MKSHIFIKKSYRIKSKIKMAILWGAVITTLLFTGCGKVDDKSKTSEKDKDLEFAAEASISTLDVSEGETEPKNDTETEQMPKVENISESENGLIDEGFNEEEAYNGDEGLKIEQVFGEASYILSMPNDDFNFKIYYKTDTDERIIYDFSEDNRLRNLEDFRFLSEMYVQDENQDGLEEVYLFFEDSAIETPMVMVLDYPHFKLDVQKGLQVTYWSYGYDIFTYEDLNGDNLKELIAPYPYGGVVTTWEGLDLVNAYNPDSEMYAFSYELTRLKYEGNKAEWKSALQNYFSTENWEGLLNSYADLGDVKACQDLIERGRALEELNIHPDWHGPYDTYFEYTLNRASYYESIWEELKPK
ncbi:hypothetical protein [Fusibacter ferrireducens]|uniref:Uncharacterized protein n=1 Tax=Fusibacter ferrireducens TaxID=2785058 RepID=A0ABR9ZSI8_9FIRM|nr:hypothetical protein [Fusibacter ferrireducens]MBF4693434.1 hypothetical protein [Fusibacter ferrireducens]